MTLAEQMRDDVDNVFCNTDEHAREVRYSQGAADKLVKAVFERGERREQGDEFGEAAPSTAMLHLPTTTAGIAEPALADRVVIDDDTWEVAAIDGDPLDGMVTLELRLVEGRRAGRDVRQRRYD